MLVLGREAGERVLIYVAGRKIAVQVVRAGRSVRLGIDAPDDVRIVREEVDDGRSRHNE